MSETIFTIPIAPNDYDLSLGSVMIHNLSAPPGTSTKIMTIPQFKIKLACNIISAGTFLIFKKPGNSDEFNIEAGDIGQGWFSSTLYIIRGIYLGGLITELSSWNILESLEF